MIIELLYAGVQGLIQLVIGIIPNVPAIPETIENAGDTIIQFMVMPVYFLQYIYGATMLTAIVTVLIAILAFDQIYSIIMYILRKIPFLNIN